MTETQFMGLVEAWFDRTEDAIEAVDPDIDASRSGKVLTIDLSDHGGGQVVVNAQAAIQELWLASRLGAYHFRWDAAREAWLDTRSAQTYAEILQRDFSTLTGKLIRL